MIKQQTFFIFFLWHLLIRAQFITYDTGVFYSLCQGCSCQNGMNRSATLNFNGAFAKPPQVIITSVSYDLEPSTNGFYFSISTITETSCTFIMYCPYVHLIWTYRFNWVAIDDQRIEVINSFNTSVAGQSNIIFTFPHSNVNALNGFITQTSFGFVGPFNHYLYILSIDYHQVQVKFTADNINLQSLGFQVVLGTKEAFQIYAYWSVITSLTPYYSPAINIPVGYVLLAPVSAFGYSNVKNMRISISTIVTGSSVTYDIRGDSVPANLGYSIIFMNISNLRILQPFQLLKMSFTKTYSLTLDANTFKLFISELNQTYMSATTQTLVVQESVQSLTIIYTLNCDPILLTGTLGDVLQCSTCIPQIKSFAHNCSNEINQLKYHFILYQMDQINQEIFLNVTSTGFVLYQSIINREGQQNYTLINLQILNY